MKKEITDQIGETWQVVVESNRLGYYRLNVTPEVISFNRENLAQYDDFDVRKLFEETSQEADSKKSS
jgi:hypothetical protein